MRIYRFDRWQYAFVLAAAAVLLLSSSVGTTRAHAQEPAGDTIVFEADCTAVTLQVLASDAAYTSVFWRFGPDGTLGFTSKQAGSVIDLGEVPAGELVLGIYVNDTGYTYKTGPGGRNPDGLVHASVSGSTVGFEDIFGGGDFDYNDAMISFSTDECAPPPPPPVQYTLTLTVDPAGGGSGIVNGAGAYAQGVTAHPMASAAGGSHLTSWSGNCSGNSTSTDVLMDSNKQCTARFDSDVAPPPPPPPPAPTATPPPEVEGAEVGIDNTRISASPAQVGDGVTFRIDVTLTGVPDANTAEVLVEFDSAYLSYDGASVAQCQLLGIGVACDFGQIGGDFSFEVDFTALTVTSSTATDATLGADFDGPGAGGQTVAGPASADVAIVDVAGVQLPPLGDGSSVLSASGATSIPLALPVVLLGVVLGFAMGTLRRSVIHR